MLILIMTTMKKTLFALAAALLLIGAGCQDLPVGDLGREIQDRLKESGLDVDSGTGTSVREDDSATSSERKDDEARSGSRGEREDDEGEENEESEDDEDDEDGRGGQAVTTPTPTPAPAPTTAGKTYTMAQVAAHASASSCWSAVNGSVYDLTAWIGRHPGGSGAILSLCGKDGSAAFDGQHGGQGRPESELASFKIGALAK